MLFLFSLSTLLTKSFTFIQSKTYWWKVNIFWMSRTSWLPRKRKNFPVAWSFWANKYETTWNHKRWTLKIRNKKIESCTYTRLSSKSKNLHLEFHKKINIYITIKYQIYKLFKQMYHFTIKINYKNKQEQIWSHQQRKIPPQCHNPHDQHSRQGIKSWLVSDEDQPSKALSQNIPGPDNSHVCHLWSKNLHEIFKVSLTSCPFPNSK